MEVAGDPSPCPTPATGSSSSSKLLRYPLRSGSRSKEMNPPTAASPNASLAYVPKRGKSSSAVSKSSSVLEIFSKDKSVKPTLARPSASPYLATAGSITPKPVNTRISKDHGKSITPLSDVSRSSSGKKVSSLSSVSYWLSQIKLSETASKHSISLGFFKLALESGCEPFDRVRKELKSYVKRHNLGAELQEPLRDLLQSYNIVEDLEKLSVSETFPNQNEDVLEKQDDDSLSLPSTEKTRSLTAEMLNTKDTAVSVVNTNNIDKVEKRQRASRSRGGYNKNDPNTAFSKATSDDNTGKKPQKAKKYSNEVTIKKSGMDSTETEGDHGAVSSQPTEEVSQDKENVVRDADNLSLVL